MKNLLLAISILTIIILACGGSDTPAQTEPATTQPQPAAAAPIDTPLPPPAIFTPAPIIPSSPLGDAATIKTTFKIAGFTFDGNAASTADAMASVILTGDPPNQIAIAIALPRPPTEEQAQRMLFYIAAMCAVAEDAWPDCAEWTMDNLNEGAEYQGESIAAALSINEGADKTNVTFIIRRQ